MEQIVKQETACARCERIGHVSIRIMLPPGAEPVDDLIALPAAWKRIHNLPHCTECVSVIEGA